MAGYSNGRIIKNLYQASTWNKMQLILERESDEVCLKRRVSHSAKMFMQLNDKHLLYKQDACFIFLPGWVLHKKHGYHQLQTQVGGDTYCLYKTEKCNLLVATLKHNSRNSTCKQPRKGNCISFKLRQQQIYGIDPSNSLWDNRAVSKKDEQQARNRTYQDHSHQHCSGSYHGYTVTTPLDMSPHAWACSCD